MADRFQRANNIEREGTLPVAYAQSLITCELCEKPRNAPHYCGVCGESMCEECKGIHNRGKATKDHEVVLRGTNQSKNDPRACTKHPGQMCNFCCDKCIEIGCISCIMKYHSGHKFSNIKDAVAKAKVKLSSELDGMEKKAIPQIQRAMEYLETQTNNYEGQTKDVITKLTKEAETLEILTKMYNGMTEKLAKKEESDQKTLQYTKEVLLDKKAKLMENIRLHREQENNGDQLELIKFLKRTPNSEDLKVISQLPKVMAPLYNSGTIGNEPITNQVGKMPTTMNEQKAISPSRLRIDTFS